VSLLQSFDELAAEHFTENSLGEKEAKAPGMHPVRVIPREAARSDDAVNVGVVLQLLVPGVEHAEEADFGAEMPGIGGYLKQRLRARAEQQTINQFFVLQGERSQLMGKREDDMSVGRCEQFGASRCQPAVARLALTLRAVPVSA
jgi:hypothetical protein